MVIVRAARTTSSVDLPGGMIHRRIRSVNLWGKRSPHRRQRLRGVRTIPEAMTSRFWRPPLSIVAWSCSGSSSFPLTSGHQCCPGGMKLAIHGQLPPAACRHGGVVVGHFRIRFRVTRKVEGTAVVKVCRVSAKSVRDVLDCRSNDEGWAEAPDKVRATPTSGNECDLILSKRFGLFALVWRHDWIVLVRFGMR